MKRQSILFLLFTVFSVQGFAELTPSCHFVGNDVVSKYTLTTTVNGNNIIFHINGCAAGPKNSNPTIVVRAWDKFLDAENDAMDQCQQLVGEYVRPAGFDPQMIPGGNNAWVIRARHDLPFFEFGNNKPNEDLAFISSSFRCDNIPVNPPPPGN